jgi:hypothetical protein
MTRRRRKAEETVSILESSAIREKLVFWRAEQDRICEALFQKWHRASSPEEKVLLPYTVAYDAEQQIPVAIIDTSGHVLAMIDRGPRGTVRCRWVRSAVTLSRMRDLAAGER